MNKRQSKPNAKHVLGVQDNYKKLKMYIADFGNFKQGFLSMKLVKKKG